MNIKKLLVFSFVFLLFFNGKPETASLQTPAPDFLELKEMRSDVGDDITIINLEFTKTIPWKKLNLSKGDGYFFVELPNTKVPRTTNTIKSTSPYIDHIQADETPNRTTLIRFYPKDIKQNIFEFSDVEVMDQRLVFTLDHTAYRKSLDTNPEHHNITHDVSENYSKPNELTPTTVTSEKQIIISPASNPKISLVPTVVETSKFATPSNSKESLPPEHPPLLSDGLKTQLILAAIISAALFASLLFLLSVWRFVRNRSFAADELQGAFQVKIVKTIQLASKVKLTVVQVGKEKLLLSVGPEQVQLLAHLNSVEQPIAKPLQASQNKPKFLERFAESRDESSYFSNNTQPSVFEHQNIEAPQRSSKVSQKDSLKEMQKNQTQRSSPTINPSRSNRINYAVGDDGIMDRSSANSKTVDDVAQLIREKLKGLPKLS